MTCFCSQMGKGITLAVYWTAIGGVGGYQKKIGTYDKQQWEHTIEQRILHGLTHVPKKMAKLKTELIDVDLVRGSSFPKAKPKHGLVTVTRLATLRLVLLPAYSRWWLQQTSPRVFVLLFVLYCLQLVNMALYFFCSQHIDEHVSLSEVLVPGAMMMILSIIHSQIISTQTTGARGPIRTHSRRSKRAKRRPASRTEKSASVGETGSNKYTKRGRIRSSHYFLTRGESSRTVDETGRLTSRYLSSWFVSFRASTEELRRQRCVAWDTPIKDSQLSSDHSYDGTRAGVAKDDVGCVRRRHRSLVVPVGEDSRQREATPLDDDGFESLTGNDSSENTEEVSGTALDSEIKSQTVENAKPSQGKSSLNWSPEIPCESFQSVNPAERDRSSLNLGAKTCNGSKSKNPDSEDVLFKSNPKDVTAENPDDYGSSGFHPEIKDPHIHSCVIDNREENKIENKFKRLTTPVEIEINVQCCDDVKTKLIEMDEPTNDPCDEIGGVCRHGVNTPSNKGDLPSPDVIEGEEARAGTPLRNAWVHEVLSCRTPTVDNCAGSDTDGTDPEETSTQQRERLLVRRSGSKTLQLSCAPRTHRGASESSCEESEDAETVSSPGTVGSCPLLLTEGTTSAGEWIGVTTNSEECSYSSELEESDNQREFTVREGLELNDHPFAWEFELVLLLNLSLDVGVCDLLGISCTIWETRDVKKADLSVLDISSAIIARVESMPEHMDYFYGGVAVSVVLAFLPSFCRLCDVAYDLTSQGQGLDLGTPPLPSLTASTSMVYLTSTLGSVLEGALGATLWQRAVVLIALFERCALSALFFFLLAVAERTFKQRFLYAKLFSHLTSFRRARKSELPHFRLNKVRNIKTWLSVRSYLKKRGPQRSVDVIVSAAFLITLLLLSFLSVECLKVSVDDQDSVRLHSEYNLEALVWCLALGVFLLRFMTLGTKINRKYRNLSVLITEQLPLDLLLFPPSLSHTHPHPILATEQKTTRDRSITLMRPALVATWSKALLS
uniref:PHTF1/2 N-terminal domain-containing protein n=1 Tax=Timema tahoe TaxID=61484 RepID=A0A7R9FGP8_9NEOP|nr:unnamed protein product [Timema tahoe]